MTSPTQPPPPSTRFVASFRVDGIPKPQPRPRAFARKMGDKFVARVFDAGTAEEWKSRIALAARPEAPAMPLSGPVVVEMVFRMPRPKGRCRRKDIPDAIPCTSRPDLDNLCKAVLDCLTQEGWWEDDGQVYELRARKQWHAIGGKAGLSVSVQGVAELAPALDSTGPTP